MKLYLIFIFAVFSFTAFGFKFSPMSTTINLNQNENSALMTVENDSSSPIAIQLTLAKRVMDFKGDETYPEELEDLSIYPSQLILPPFEKRTIKVSYLGNKTLKEEKSFRVIAEQLPLEVDKANQKTNVKILLRYIAALYVNINDTKSNIELKRIEFEDKNINFYVKNSGNRHQVLSNLKLLVKNKNQKEVLIESKSLKGFSGENILSGNDRQFKIALTEELKAITKDSEVEMQFDKE